VLDKLRSRLVHVAPTLMSVPVKLTPFALKRQVLQQVLSWQFRQALMTVNWIFSTAAG
jgi:predicted lipid carrier protein YhbT